MNDTAKYYEDKVAVVTGGASGVGLALAETMLSYGARKVVLADFNDENLTRETERLDASYPGRVLGVRCDVTREAEVQAMIVQAAEFGDGRIDLLLNNAGSGLVGWFDELTVTDWEQGFALNFYGALYGIRAVLPIMRAQGGGHIVNIISGIAFWPMAHQSRYAVTKAALLNLSLSLRYEMWDEDIRVTPATPGTTISGIWEAAGQEPPADAQTAEQSAQTVLAGVARNDRIVFGTEDDREGAKTCFHPDAAEGNDAYLLDNARRRRRGETAL